MGKRRFCNFHLLISSALVISVTALAADNTSQIPEPNLTQSPGDEQVVQLAKKRFRSDREPLRYSEEMFLRAAVRGEPVDFGPLPVDNSSDDAQWSASRTIRAELLAWVCEDPTANSFVTVRGIRLSGAKIAGDLDLDSAKVPFPLLAFNCYFTGRINLDRASIPGLYLSNTHVQELHAYGVAVRDSVVLDRGFTAEGLVDFNAAEINRDFVCSQGKFMRGSHADQLNPMGATTSLEARNAKIGGTIDLNSFLSIGEVNLTGATIGSNLECVQAQFLHSNKRFPHIKAGGLEAQAVKVGGDVLFGDEQMHVGFTAEGLVDLRSAIIANKFVWFGVETPQYVVLDLRKAKVGTASIEPGTKPEEGFLQLEGFIYDDIEPLILPNANDPLLFLKWQSKEPFFAQPYEQLARVLQNKGLHQQARQVMIRMHIDEGRNAIGDDWQSSEYVKLVQDVFWYKVFGKLIGFGYSPWNALGMSVLLILCGSALFQFGFWCKIVTPSDEEKAYYSGTRQLRDTYPKFQAIIYSLETFVPLVKLGIQAFWGPNAHRALRLGKLYLPFGNLFRIYLWAHIIAGWILTSLWLVAFTGLLKTPI